MLAAAIFLREPLPSAQLILHSHASSGARALRRGLYRHRDLLASEVGDDGCNLFVVAGQLIGSILFDRFGISGGRTSRGHQKINRLAFSRAV
jgi:hypothetical protein